MRFRERCGRAGGWAVRVLWAALAVLTAGACTFAPGGLKAALAGDAVLNWSEQLLLDEWEGVSTGGAEDAPARVTELQLDGRGHCRRIGRGGG